MQHLHQTYRDQEFTTLITQLCIVQNDIVATHKEVMVQMRTNGIFYSLKTTTYNYIKLLMNSQCY